MILKYELKKMFSKKINRILLIAALLAAVALSVFAVGSARYVDENGEAHTGFMAARRLSADRNRWAGELTGDKIAQVVGSRQEINSKYSYQVPNEEYGKTIQSYSDIENFVIGVLTPDTDWDESVLYRLEDGQARELYSIYEGNLQEMAQEYGATPEQQHFLGSRSDAVFFSAKYGRTKATKNKVLAGMLAATVVYFAGMGIMLVLSLGVMGLSGFSTPYQIDQPYSIYAMTYGQYFLLTVLCGYIASLLAASVTMLIAARMRSARGSLCTLPAVLCHAIYRQGAFRVPYIFQADAGYAGQCDRVRKEPECFPDRGPCIPADPVYYAALFYSVAPASAFCVQGILLLRTWKKGSEACR